MTKKVKAGTYWRTLFTGDNIVEVIRLLEDGWDTSYLPAVRVNDPKQIVNLVQLNNPKHHWYRCKKDGSWFGTKQTDAQKRNRELLSLEWQLKGAIANMKSVLARHGRMNNHLREIERQAESALMWMKTFRQIEIARMKSQALSQKKKGG